MFFPPVCLPTVSRFRTEQTTAEFLLINATPLRHKLRDGRDRLGKPSQLNVAARTCLELLRARTPPPVLEELCFTCGGGPSKIFHFTAHYGNPLSPDWGPTALYANAFRAIRPDIHTEQKGENFRKGNQF